MSDICVPAGTDWSCAFDADTLAGMRDNPTEAAKLERAEAFAWTTLASLTAYRIGTCPVTVRPCAARCTPDSHYLTAIVRSSGSWLGSNRIGGPFISGGNWYNACGCRSQNDCSCTALSEVILPGPVGAIASVTIDGVYLPRSAYRVDNGNRLVRLDGGQWPACQDMATPGAKVYESVTVDVPGNGPDGPADDFFTLVFTRAGDVVTATATSNYPEGGGSGTFPTPWAPNSAAPIQPVGLPPFVTVNISGSNPSSIGGPSWTTGPFTFSYIATPDDEPVDSTGSFEVTYYRSTAPNIMTRAAAGVLANEFYLACGGQACRLPWNIVSMARSGESYEFGEEGGVEGIATAIPEVAALVNIYNPYGLKSAPFVASPDMYDVRTPTWS